MAIYSTIVGLSRGLRNSYTIRHRRENPIVKNKLPSESHCYSTNT